ncbi:MAG: helix-turn-helix domain-containing protein [Clostridia bacterium]|nr:helix-turn-helix domain-containing protein [Clostridia bacterium]
MAKPLFIRINNFYSEIFPVAKIEDENLPVTHHNHSHTEIFSCTSGSIMLKFSDDSVVLHSGDAVIIPAGVKHSRLPDTKKDTVWNAIGIICSKRKNETDPTEDFYSRLSPFINGSNIWFFRNKPDFCNCIQKICTEEKCGIRDTLEFIYEFYNAVRDKKAGEIIAPKENQPKNLDRFILLDRLLNFEYMRPFSNKEIADRLHIGQRQLSRLVVSHYGAPLHRLIIKRRIETAAERLINTNYSIEEISHAVGFSNKTVFYNEFKAEYGTTPAQYRKNAE